MRHKTESYTLTRAEVKRASKAIAKLDKKYGCLRFKRGKRTPPEVVT